MDSLFTAVYPNCLKMGFHISILGTQLCFISMSLPSNDLSHSLDTLDPFKFEFMTRRRGHDAVLRSLEVALDSSLEAIKLNVVVVKGLNDSEILDFVEMTKNNKISVRFIEFMPFTGQNKLPSFQSDLHLLAILLGNLYTGNKWDKMKMVPSSELLEKISSRHPNVFRAPDSLNDTARSWQIPGYSGSFGFISSMSDHFCSTCNRLRITADGQIKVSAKKNIIYELLTR